MTLSKAEAVQEIQNRIDAAEEDIIKFMREIVAIPSMEGQLKDVGDRIAAEMNKLGFDEVGSRIFDKIACPGILLTSLSESVTDKQLSGWTHLAKPVTTADFSPFAE